MNEFNFVKFNLDKILLHMNTVRGKSTPHLKPKHLSVNEERVEFKSKHVYNLRISLKLGSQ